MTAGRFRDLVFYAVIGLFFTLLYVWFAQNEIELKWLSLTFETGAVFGSAIGLLRHRWRKRAFWVSLGALLAVHIAVLSALVSRFREWRGPNVSLFFIVETVIVMGICELVSRVVEKRRRGQGKDDLSL